MKRSLRQEIQQSKPFAALEEEVYLELLLTAQVTRRRLVETLKEFELSPSQFNVLRILRGARPGALPSSRIAERMVDHDPDVTRLLDRLEAAGFAEKARDDADRRVVNVRITQAGLDRVASASAAVTSQLKTMFGPLGRARLESLADLLELVRQSQRDQAVESLDSIPTDTRQKEERHGDRKESRPDHGSHGPAGRRRRAGAARQGASRARADAGSRKARGA